MKESINNRYTIEITTLTPISIGAGAEKDWVNGADFVIDNYKLYKLNLRKMIAAGVDPHKLASSLEQRNENKIIELIAGNLEKVSDAIYECPLNNISNDVKTFVRNQLTGKPIVPGSSLKGAIRSVLLKYLMSTKDKKLNEETIFGSTKDGDEFMRFIKISDAEFIETKLLNSKIFNLYRDEFVWEGGWKHSNSSTNSYFKPNGFNTLYEVANRGQKGYCDIMLSLDLFQQVVSKMPESVINNNLTSKVLDIKQLFAIINKHTSQHIKKEIAFFKKYSNNETPQIIDCLQELLKEMGDDNSCVLKMSAGSGFHSITGDWQFDDYSINGVQGKRGIIDGEKSAKSRKIIIDGGKFMPMGFVKLRILSEEELRQREADQAAMLEARAEEMRLAREREEALAQAEKQRQIEEQNKRNRFGQLINEAQTSLNNRDVELSQELLQKSEELYPGDPRLSDLNRQLLTLLDEHKRDKLNKEVAQADAAKYRCPLAEKLSKVSNIRTAIGNVKPWLKNNQKASLDEQDKAELKDALTRIYNNMSSRDQKKAAAYSNWKELEIHIGVELTHLWHSELTNNAL